ncbi:MAG: glycoside hydrolase family 97 protein [Candidatus Marinimicrobia bacterium]|nr:glycoside hydrolase family 97 protein [Candidatus Neomarinimicrobiota bacterium]
MHKNLFIITLIVSLLLITNCTSLKPKNSSVVSSPDGKVVVEFIIQDGKAYYKVLYEQDIIINYSKLGFEFKNAEPLDNSFVIKKTSVTHFDEVWEPVCGSDSLVKNTFNELIVMLEQNTHPKRKLNIIFRAYDDGIGFRYILPDQPDLRDFEIINEETQFNFMTNSTAWWIPADFDSYEHLYNQTLLSEIAAVNTPITMKTDKGLYLSVHEADLTDYPGMTLKAVDNEPFSFECDLVPWPDSVKVKASTPHRSPWRTIQIATRPGQLIESHLIENLNDPCQWEDVSWIKPMKYMGIWWGMHIGTETWGQGPYHGATTENARRYIDFAAEHGISGLLIEGWNTGWESWGQEDAFNFKTAYDDFDLPKVARYAKEKGIELIGHHETGGQVGNYEKNLTAAFELYQQLGINAVKTGYAGTIRPEGQHHHGQWMVNHYRNVVKKAAEYKIMVDVHEPIKPTGIRRTYPNMVTREGVQGMEFNAWSKGNPPEHTTIIPFTRMLAGPIDYTPGIFDVECKRHLEMRKNAKLRNNFNRRVHTTLAKQLALYVIIYSPMQMAADFPENYAGQPAFKFIQDVPVNWDESKVLDAEIGDFVIIARRNNEDWFVGAITDEKQRALEIPLSFLKSDKKYKVTLYSDGPNTDWETNPTDVNIASYLVDNQDILPANLPKGGGLALQITPANADELEKLKAFE